MSFVCLTKLSGKALLKLSLILKVTRNDIAKYFSCPLAGHCFGFLVLDEAVLVGAFLATVFPLLAALLVGDGGRNSPSPSDSPP